MDPQPNAPSTPPQHDGHGYTTPDGGTPPALRSNDPPLSPAEADDEIGRVGKYRVLGEIGRGGMGVVYRAEDPVLGRTVALKVLLPQIAGTVGKARFLREARAQARVEHDHVIVIHEVGEAGGLPYIVMPLLLGRTLEAAIRADPDGRLDVRQVLRVGREIAEGLAAAHAKGLVHRDVKPSNVWLESPTERVKLLDFGLAFETGGPLTGGGEALGTPGYMSPEQARCELLDHRSDLWSLGAVLHRMATGRLPSVGACAPAKSDALVDAVPPALGALIAQLLAPRPTDRPTNATEIANALRAIEGGSPTPATGGPKPRTARLRGAVLGSLLLATGLGVGYVATRYRPKAIEEPAEKIALPDPRIVVGEKEELPPDD